MSVNDQPGAGAGAPVAQGSPLARALDDFAVPGLSAGFADRVLAAAQARPAPLPPLRRARSGRRRRWGRGIVIGVVSFGALASAAAATGLLEQFNLPVPSAQKVWASVTGKQPAIAVAAVPAVPRPATSVPAPVAITGPIDTPEELSEAFRRIDAVRQGRRETRSQLIDQWFASELERRRAAGLPLPSPEEEARLRQRIDAAQTRRQQLADERIALRREAMARKVESGAVLTREDILRPLPESGSAPGRRERLERLRQLPPEQRRELIETWRERRAQRAERAELEAPADSAVPAPEVLTVEPDAAADPGAPPP